MATKKLLFNEIEIVSQGGSFSGPNASKPAAFTKVSNEDLEITNEEDTTEAEAGQQLRDWFTSGATIPVYEDITNNSEIEFNSAVPANKAKVKLYGQGSNAYDVTIENVYVFGRKQFDQNFMYYEIRFQRSDTDSIISVA